MLAPTLLALLALAQAPPQAPAPGPVESSADKLIYERTLQRMHLRGHAQLRRDGLLLRADEIDYDEVSRRAQARGNVLFSDGLMGASALAVDVDLVGEQGVLEGATLYQKKWTSPQAVAGADTPAAMARVGRNALTLKADEVQRLSAAHFLAKGLWLSTCDCRDGDQPSTASWSVRASRADVEPGERVVLSWPIIYIRDVPVLPLPGLYLPLSDRRTGFLLPRPNFTSRNGFQLELPFFWAINVWSDLTITPGYFTGLDNRGACQTRAPFTAGPNDFGENDLCEPAYGLFASGDKEVGTDPGMRGPRLGLEYRYTPTEHTRGKADMALVYDLKPALDPNPNRFMPNANEALPNGKKRGLRGELSLIHDQDLGLGFGDHAEIAALTDGAYFRDITADLVAQQASYLPSSARVDHRSDNTDAFISASYYQDLSHGGPPGSLNPFYGPGNVNALTFQRLPALQLTMPEQLLGPVAWSLETSAVRYAPLQEHPDRLALCATPGKADTCAPTALWREVEERLDLAPTVRVPLQLGRFGELAPYAQVREDAWLIEGTQRTDRTYALVGATASTELARTYATGDGKLRHVLDPVVEVRAVPWARGGGPATVANSQFSEVVGGGPTLPNDEIDSALPYRVNLFQAVAALRTRLDRKRGGLVDTPLVAEVGQAVDLLGRQPGEAFASATYQTGPFQLTGSARYDWRERELSLLSARGAYTNSLLTAVATYQRLGEGLTDPARASLTELIGPEPFRDGVYAEPRFLAEQLDLALSIRPTRALSFEPGLTLVPHIMSAPLVSKSDGYSDPATSRAEQIWRGVLGYRLGFGYGSPCDCWGIHLAAFFQPPATPGRPWVPVSFTVVLDAQRVGGISG